MVSISLGGSFGTGGGRLGSDVSFGLMAEVVGVGLVECTVDVCDDPPRQWLSGRGVAPEEPSVSQCQSVRSVHPYVALVESSHFDHYAGSVTFGGEVSRLVLHPDMGANPQWWKGSAHRSDARAWRWRSACSLLSRLSLHVACGMYLPGSRGSKSRVGRPNTHMAGDC